MTLPGTPPNPADPLDGLEPVNDAFFQRKKINTSVQNMGAYGKPEEVKQAMGVAAQANIDPFDAMDPKLREYYKREIERQKIPVDRLVGTQTAEWAGSNPLHYDLLGAAGLESLLTLEKKKKEASMGFFEGIANTVKDSLNTAYGSLQQRGASIGKGLTTDFIRSLEYQQTHGPDWAKGSKLYGELSADPVGDANTKIRADRAEAARLEFDAKWFAPAAQEGAARINQDRWISQAIGGAAPDIVSAMLISRLGGASAPAAALPAADATVAGKSVFAKLGTKVVNYFERNSGDMAKQALGMYPGLLSAEADEYLQNNPNESRVEAVGKSITSAIAQSVMEGLVNVPIIERMQAAKTVTKRITGLMLSGQMEGAEEVFQRIASQYLLPDPSGKRELTLQDLWENYRGGMVAGIAFGGAALLPNRHAKAQENFIKSFADPDLREKLGPAMRSFVDSVTNGTPQETLAVDAKGFVEHFQSQNMTLEEAQDFAVKNLEVTPEDFTMAVKNGGDLIVPTGAYAEFISGTEHGEGIYAQTRVNQGGPKMAELAQQHATQQYTEEIQKAMAALDPNDSERDVIKQEITAMLSKASRVLTPSQAEGIADNYARVIAVQAKRAGITTTELYQKEALNIKKDALDNVIPKAESHVLGIAGVQEVHAAVNSVRGGNDQAMADKFAALGIDTTQHMGTIVQALMQHPDREAVHALLTEAVQKHLPKPNGPVKLVKLNQSVTLRMGKETLAKYGLLPPTGKQRHSIRTVAAALEARQRDKYGSIALNDRSQVAAEKIARWVVDEVKFELLHPDVSAVGWYTTKFQSALDIFGTKYPELKTSKPARDMFTALVAICSDGQKVYPNFLQAADIYSRYRETGKFTLSRGHSRAASIRINLKHLENLLNQYGPEGLHTWMMQESTVGELKKLAKQNGTKFGDDYQKGVKLPMAAGVFGPKLGAFYANLMGAQGYLTMDRWWSRTFNRYRGELQIYPTSNMAKHFSELTGVEYKTNDEMLIAATKAKKDYETRYKDEDKSYWTRLEYMVGEKVGKTSAEKQAWEAKVAALPISESEREALRAEADLEKTSNSIFKALIGLRDAPEGAPDRTFMIKTVAEAQKMLARSRPSVKMTTADIQAVLWYYEKRLYGELGAEKADDSSYEEIANKVVNGAEPVAPVADLFFDTEGQLTIESMPGSVLRTDIFPGIGKATAAQLTAYHQEKMVIIHAALTEAGFTVDRQKLGAGYWDGESNPVTAFVIKLKGIDANTPLGKQQLDMAAQIAADVIGDQDGVGWNSPIFNEDGSTHNALRLNLNRALTPEEVVEFGKALDAAKLDSYPDASDTSELRVISYGDMPAAELHSKIGLVMLNSLPADIEFKELGSYNSASNLVNRSANANITSNQTDTSGRSDLQGRSIAGGRAKVLALNERYRTEFGWGTTADSGPRVVARENSPADAVSATGIHWSTIEGAASIPTSFRNGSESQETPRLAAINLELASDQDLAPLLNSLQLYLPGRDKEKHVRGNNQYTVTIDGLLDVEANQLVYDELVAKAKTIADDRVGAAAIWQNQLEKLIYEAGYNGYINRGVIKLLGQSTVPVKDITPPPPITEVPGPNIVELDQPTAAAEEDPFASMAGVLERKLAQYEAATNKRDRERLAKSVADTVDSVKDTITQFEKYSKTQSDLSMVGVGGAKQLVDLLNKLAAPPTQKMVDTTSKQFQEFFADSKVVNKDGSPMVVYHATNSKFLGVTHGTINPAYGIGSFGFHVGTTQQSNAMNQQQGGHTLPLYAAIKNPIRLKDQGSWSALGVWQQLVELRPELDPNDSVMVKIMRMSDKEGVVFVQDQLKAAGYDGVVYLNRYEAISKRDQDRINKFEEDGSDHNALPESELRKLAPSMKDSYITFDASQLKSAVSNTGAFSGKTILDQPAYHGSPFKFDQFTLDHIGEGEGSQAYGWGLYFAGDKNVAEWYREKLSGTSTPQIDGKAPDYNNPAHVAAMALWFHTEDNVTQTAKSIARDRARAIEDLNMNRERLHEGLWEEEKLLGGEEWKIEAINEDIRINDEALALLESGAALPTPEAHKGQTYKVDIPEDSTMLDWDKPFIQQSPEVQAALRKTQYWQDMMEQQAKHNADGATLDRENKVRGAVIYDGIKLYMPAEGRSDKHASLFLNSLGISGIKYADGNTRNKADQKFNYVVFDDKAIKTLQTFYQPEASNSPDGKQPPRGRLSYLVQDASTISPEYTGEARKFDLQLFEGEDKSTIFHELGHFYLELLGDVAAMPNADQSVKDDYASILKWLGAENRAGITKEMHEKFADGHLAYMAEGNAPIPELKKPFAKYSEWLTKLAAKLFKEGKSILSVPVNMNAEVRGVFDRLYAASDAIEEAKSDVIFQMFTTAEQANMTPAEFKAYTSMAENELTKAKEKLLAKMMKQLDLQQQADYQEKLQVIKDEIEASLNAKPEYKAALALAKGIMDDDATPVPKLDAGLLVDMYGKDILDRLPKEGTRTVFADKGETISPDDAAVLLNVFGTNGDSLIQAMTDLPNRQVTIDSQAQARMDKEHPNLLTDEVGLRREAMALLQGAERENVLALELRQLRRAQLRAERAAAPALQAAQAAAQDRKGLNRELQRNSAQEARDKAQAAREAGIFQKITEFRAAARDHVRNTPFWKLNPGKFLAEQQKASKEAYNLALKGKYQLSSEAKEREMLSHFLYVESTAAVKRSEKFRAFIKTSDSATSRANMAKAGKGLLAQFDFLRDRFTVERLPNKELERKENLQTFAERMAAEEIVIIKVEDWIMDESQPLKNWRELTVQQMMDLHDTLISIKHAARGELQVLVNGKWMFYDAIQDDLKRDAEANLPFKPIFEESSTEAKSAKEKAKRWLAGSDSSLNRILRVVNWIDGNNVRGSAHTYIWNPIKKAQAVYHELTLKLNKPILDQLNAQPKGWRKSLKETFDIGLKGEDGNPRMFSRAEIIGMVLYNGQTDRYAKLLGGRVKGGFTEAAMLKAFTHLTKADLAYAESIWKSFEDLKPVTLDLEERETGVRPEWAANREFDVRGPNGELTGHMKGGYFPLVADRSAGTKTSLKQEGGTVQQVLANNGLSRARTSQGHTEKLTGEVYPLLLDVERIVTSELNNQIKDASYREAVLMLNRIFSSQRFKDTMYHRLGREQTDQFNHWLISIISDGNDGATNGIKSWDDVVRKARGNAVSAMIPFKVMSMMVQPLDQLRALTPGIEHGINPLRLAQAWVQLNWANPNRTKTIEMIKTLSPEMANSIENVDRDLRGNLQRLAGDNSWKAAAERMGYAGYAAIDTLIRWPTWLAKYNEQMAKHNDSDLAVAEADDTVGLLLQAGAPKDLTPVQANTNPYWRLFTMFMGDASANYGILRDAGSQH